ncbi:MAG TPA: PilZ domain-containing protein [Dokdonella sp.]|uniref:PilZ domain-containing protein n=2 Tax=Dokdonella sp. TaxID=2291710 RepID=UPI002B76095F|nr:PilZ domain-containing protein [Dokdonella sp.]HOX71972.1 PilZ domain-containing protein [Dokdonella sp.]HPG94302.1 PilZ domain-containing protein [Dokdonella sp.]HPN80286.1 PilZ domain-containing protein [Dokdonella sp.]
MSADEKRRFPRMPIFSAALITHQGQGWLSEVRDLSQGGACLARPHRWSSVQSTECRIYFIFDQETVVAVDARCVREGSEDLGFEFDGGQESEVETLLYESRFINQDEP